MRVRFATKPSKDVLEVVFKNCGQMLQRSGTFNSFAARTTFYGLSYLIFSGTNASHALIDFGEDGTAIVPFTRIVEDSLCDSRCRVVWSDKKEYKADFIFTGNF